MGTPPVPARPVLCTAPTPAPQPRRSSLAPDEPRPAAPSTTPRRFPPHSPHPLPVRREQVTRRKRVCGQNGDRFERVICRETVVRAYVVLRGFPSRTRFVSRRTFRIWAEVER